MRDGATLEREHARAHAEGRQDAFHRRVDREMRGDNGPRDPLDLVLVALCVAFVLLVAGLVACMVIAELHRVGVIGQG